MNPLVSHIEDYPTWGDNWRVHRCHIDQVLDLAYARSGYDPEDGHRLRIVGYGWYRLQPVPMRGARLRHRRSTARAARSVPGVDGGDMTAILSLCSGYGGLDMAVDGQVVAVAETDKHASTVLAHHHPNVPNLGDITTITEWPDAEVITAGYPCQPFSTAGNRKGVDDPRHIWPHVLRAIRMVRPRHVILENVAGHLSLGFDTVLADLAGIGFDADWAIVRASDVGAPHQRARLFVVAYPHGQPARGDSGTDAGTKSQDAWRAEDHGHRPADGVGAAPNPDSPGQQVECRPSTMGRPTQRFGRYQPAVDRWAHIIGRPPPDPMAGRQLNARLVEWMMGLPDGWVTDLIPNRAALKVLGNGVVPQQAAHAIRHLASRMVGT